ncbi:DUF2975 domain-containing protein [Roseateles oligotrophus]|uniref:DUF2975 domain-containing protein n=1 Tax=Roseateles oligotrophus TaxID=1769250 RepID=A0ABT2YBW1_9BURK|nr:DUF2975 domain-containing protein [Roseateles oligotrophus]MCV2366710.1 DUF2975 domain-containing protein [Roseateles oligotrophus]
MDEKPHQDRDKLGRVRRLSWWVRLFCLLGGLALLLVPAMLWSQPEWLESVARKNWLTNGAPLQLDAGSRFWGWLSSCLPGAVLLYALWQVWSLFGYYRRGEIFKTGPATHLRRLGAALMVNAIAQPLSTTLAVLALTLGNPVGQRQLVLALSLEQYSSFGFGLAVLVIGIVMQEAARVAQENAEFV